MALWYQTFFGEPWPSGICEESEQVETPVGELCAFCYEAVVDGDQGSFIGTPTGPGPIHRECSLRSALGGIGHLTNHYHWCKQMGDPDGGFSRRQSALRVWRWVAEHGLPASPP